MTRTKSLLPVNWVLTSKQNTEPADLLLVSQYEVNQLFEEIYMTSARVKLATYEPSITKSILAIDVARQSLWSNGRVFHAYLVAEEIDAAKLTYEGLRQMIEAFMVAN